MTNLIWPKDDSSVVSWIKLGLVHKINEVGLKYASEWIRSSVSRLVVFDKKNFTRSVRSRLHRCKTTDFPFF